MKQSDFVDVITRSIAGHLAKNFGARGVTHHYTDNLKQQVERVSSSNPQLSSLQILSMMFAEDPQSDVFQVAFDELQDPSRVLVALKIDNVPEPKVRALVIGKSTM